MKKVNLALFVFLLLIFLPSSLFHANAKTITIDGSFDDWDDVDTFVEDAVAGSPYTGTIYYFNTTTHLWQTELIADTCMYTQDRALDLGELKLTNDNDNFYVLWERGSGFLNYYWRKDGATEEADFDDDPATAANNNPCVGEIVIAPAAFDHDLVVSIDIDNDDAFEYYIVVNITFDAGAYEDPNATGNIYEDNGNGIYSKGTEILATSLNEPDYALSDVNTDGGELVLQEAKISMDTLLNNIDINWGDTVTIRYEAHSDAVDVSDTAEYTFSQTTSSSSNTFHKDTRCGAIRPQAPQWVMKYPTLGGANLIWSAMGGDRVDIEITNGSGEYEYKYIKVLNNGHKFLPNVDISQSVRVRVYNECKYGEWHL